MAEESKHNQFDYVRGGKILVDLRDSCPAYLVKFLVISIMLFTDYFIRVHM